MKKFGFTLAEVLITLGIVGVVSALVLPTFTAQVTYSKVGPKLAKAVASFEQATMAIIDEEGANLSGIGLNSTTGSPQAYPITARLLNYLKATRPNVMRLDTVNGTSYVLESGSAHSDFSSQTGLPHQKIYWDRVCIDINGLEVSPNKSGRDRFYFQLMDDGSLRPWGGSWEEAEQRWHENDNRGLCEKNRKPVNPDYCAGHVMENGLKVEYN